MSAMISGDGSTVSDSKMLTIAEDDFQENSGLQQRPSTAPERSSITDTSELSRASFRTARTDVMKKYDLNNDGKFDGQEVENIINEYINTLNKHANLSESHKTQKRIIAFGAIMIILLSLSNFATAFLAVNLSKETRIVNGKMVSKDGSGSAIMTEAAVKNFSSTQINPRERRRSLKEGVMTEWKTFACYTPEEVEEIVSTVAESGIANTILRDRRNVIQRIIPLTGSVTRNYGSSGSRRELQNSLGPMVIEFSEVGVAFVENDPNCVDRGRRLSACGDDQDDCKTIAPSKSKAPSPSPPAVGAQENTVDPQPAAATSEAPSVAPTSA